MIYLFLRHVVVDYAQWKEDRQSPRRAAGGRHKWLFAPFIGAFTIEIVGLVYEVFTII